MVSATVICHLVLVMNVLLVSSQERMNLQDFMFAAKHVPRIGRSANKNGMSEFDKFFMKVSKSVPRIGRRNEGEQVVNTDYRPPLLLKYPIWPDISYLYEYEPELFETSEDLFNILNPNLNDQPQQANNKLFERK